MAPHPLFPGVAHTATPDAAMQAARDLQTIVVEPPTTAVLAQQMSPAAQSSELRQQPESPAHFPGPPHVGGALV